MVDVVPLPDGFSIQQTCSQDSVGIGQGIRRPFSRSLPGVESETAIKPFVLLANQDQTRLCDLCTSPLPGQAFARSLAPIR